ncbi:MAG: PilZ domain-containing protein [Alphaproteobacteria bacterium]|nr:PilZ domain-containing protein [Alphaproteobacteria bacterium]
MKIVREKPSQRRYHRLTAPLTVFYQEKKFKVRDWSIGGIGLYIGETKQPRVGREFALKISLPFQGYDIQFDASVRVVRFDEKARLVGLEFVDLSERSKDLLTYFSEDLIRGHMGTFEDSICRIDVPVTPISTKPTTSHISETPVRRLPLKTIFMTLAYVFFGVAIFSYLGLLLYSNFFRLEIKSSVISTEMRTLKMPVDGVVNIANLKVGDQFELGQKLFSYEDISLEKEIIIANRKVKQAQKNLWRSKQKHHIERERMSLYQIVSNTDKNITKAKLSALRVALAAADANLIRIHKLQSSNLPSEASYEDALTEQAKAASLVKQTELLLEKNTAMATASSRRYYNNVEFVNDLDLLVVDLEMAYSQLEAENDKLDNLLSYKSNTIITAPFPGRVTKIYQPLAGNVAKNEPIILFERNDKIFVTAFLNQQEILQISLDDIAKIYIPAVDQNITAVVTHIDRNSLLLNESSTHYVWRDEKARSAAVRLHLNMDSPLQAGIRPGLPVVTIFTRKSTSGLWSALSNMFTSNSSNTNVRENEKT